MDNFYKYVPIGLFILQLLMAWAFWSLQSAFVSKDHCDDCQKDTSKIINGLKVKTQDVEANLKNVPSVKNIHDLSLQISTMAGDIRSLSEILERVEQKVMRQEDYLMHQGGK